MTDAPLLLRQDNDHIATLTLNRPDKFNALSDALLAALTNEIKAIGNDRDIRVVVIQGAGRAFCAGHDLKEMRADSSDAAMKDLFGRCSAMMLAITSIPQPVIAKVHATATAAGCQLVAACDLAIAATEARFATSGINVGLFCSTPMVPLSRNVPRKKAFELLVTGDFIPAEEALAYGLVNKVVSADMLDQATDELAQKLAQKAPSSLAHGKRLFYKQLEAAEAVAYDMAAQTMACNMQDEDARAGIDAFIAKQPMPEWKGR